MTVLYSLVRWFSGEILNSPDTRKPKTHFCQYYHEFGEYTIYDIIGAIKLIHSYQAFL